MTPLFWLSYFASVDGRAQWDGGQGILGDLFDGRLGPVPSLCQMTNEDGTIYERHRGSVFVVPGQHHADARSVEWLNEDMARSERVLLILHGDECSLFPWQDVEHPDVRMWVMTPRRSAHGTMPDGTRFIGEGAGPRWALPDVPKDLDVVFMGQTPANHPRRQELADVLADLPPDRALVETTPGFMQGRPRADYLSQMARAKIAPCPAGACTTDSFRCWEALEMGAVPVVERRTPDGIDHEQWELTYPGGLPFPIVDDWHAFAEALPMLLAEWETLAAACGEWWRDRKAEMARWLSDDVAWLAGADGTVTP